MANQKSSTLVNSLPGAQLSGAPGADTRVSNGRSLNVRSLNGQASNARSTELHADYPFHANMHFVEGRRRSLLAALAGIHYTFRTQPNVWIELAAVGVVIATGLGLQISGVEWALLMLTFGSILALEAMNTAVETVVDLVSPRYHPLARIAKDTAAGALLLAVLSSVGVAAFVFGPRLLALLG